MSVPVSEPGAEAMERARQKAKEVLRICVREATQAHRESAIAALIARALEAERLATVERCAQIAEQHQDHIDIGKHMASHIEAPWSCNVAAAIRLAAPTPKEG